MTTTQSVEERIRQAIAEVLGVEPAELDPRAPIASFGLQSVEMVGLVGELEQWVSRELPATLIWEYPTIEGLAQHLTEPTEHVGTEPVGTEPVGTEHVGTEHVGTEPGGGTATAAVAGTDDAAGENAGYAIVGMGCRFPGGVRSPRDFWQLLTDGRDAIMQVPADRWDVEEFLTSDPTTPGRGASRWGGFVEGIDQFDPQFFGISPREAAQMDPQQRLLAEVMWEALEDAGIPAERLAGSDTGVFVGITNGDYGHLAFQDLRKVDAYTGIGNAFSIAANRLSYLWDLRGPSMAIDSACSSSLVAIAQACASLDRRETDLALVGGVNVILSPALMINFSKAGAMANGGRCRAFDAAADGYVRSEGAGAVALKRYDRAVSDGDAIYAVIRGSAVNQDGRTNGLMAPNVHAQQAVLAAAYQRAGIEPGAVDYIEAHGTGTLLGDPIEAKAIAAVVSPTRAPGAACLVGSVKTNIGHLEAAAGMAGLIKGALMVQHRVVPASLHFDQPNPHIDFEELRLRVADHRQAWPSSGRPATVGVSSFGFGGTNAHVVIQEAPATRVADAAAADLEHVLALSARTEPALRALSERYEEHLGALEDDQQLAGVCTTTTTRRTHHAHRLTCAGSSSAQLRESLAAYRGDELRPGLASGTARVGRYSKTAFVFSGQGPRWWPVAADLLTGDAGLRRSLAACDEILAGLVDWRLLDLFADGEQGALLARPEVGQPALVAVQLSLAALWQRWGVHPTTVIGHSVGEIAAAYVAGALSLEDALLIGLHRGEIIAGVAGQGKMALVDAPSARVADVLGALPGGGVWVAAVNGPDSTVVSGTGPAILALAATFAALDVEYKVLESVDFASHSPQMDAPARQLGRQLAGLQTQPTTTAMYSTALGRPVEGHELGADYWATNLRSPVMFHAALISLVDSGHDAFVEIAPHPMLAANAAACLDAAGRTGVSVSSLRRDTPGRGVLLEQVGVLHCAGVSVDWSEIDAPNGAPVLGLPTYPWQRERCWLDGGQRQHERAGAHPLLAEHTVAAGSGDHLWNIWADLERIPFLIDHQVDGAPVLPASLLLEAALTGVRTAMGITDLELLDVQLSRMTVVDAVTEEPTLQLTVSPRASGTGTFLVHGRRAGAVADTAWEQVAAGRFRPTSTDADDATDAVGGCGPLVEARRRCVQVRPVEEQYASLRRVRLEYGPAFQLVEELWTGTGEAVARLRAPEDLGGPTAGFAVHPALLDACLQVVAAALPSGATDGLYVPVGVANFRVGAEFVVPVWVRAVVPTPVLDGELTGARVLLYDDGGTQLGALDGLTLRRLAPAALDADLDAALHELEWTEDSVAAQPANDAGPDASAGWWLIFADGGGLAESVRGRLEADGVASIVVGRGPRCDTPDRLAIDAVTLADLSWLRERLDAVERGRCAGVLYARGLDVAAGDSSGDDGETMLGQAMGEAFAPVLHLVQDLAGHESGTRSPGLVVLTRGAQRVQSAGSSADEVAQAVLWGLLRVVAAEHPELRPRLLDLDPDSSADDVHFVLAELVADSTRQCVVRGGRRYRSHLRPWTPASTTTASEVPRPFVEADDANFALIAPTSGSLTELALVTSRRPAVGAGRVEIAVEAAGLNFSDVLKAIGLYPGITSDTAVLGAECTGVVTAVGAGVAGLRPGDAVIAIAPRSIGAYVTTAAHLVAARPPALTSEQSAAVPVAFLTAVYALERLARLRAGEHVLIHSATGGVGLAAIQIANRCGAEVFATAGTAAKRQLLRELGVTHVMDSRTTRFADEILATTAGRGVDVVLNSLSGDALVRSLSLLAPYGRFIELGKTDIYGDSTLGLGAFKENRSLHAVDMERCFADQPEVIAELFTKVSADLASGSLSALPVTRFAMSDAGEAFSLMARAGHIGKVVLARDGHELVTERAPSARIRADGTYLITGGMGALGLHVAQSFVDRGARHLALLGRTAPSPSAAARVDALRSAGATVTIIRGDVTQHADLRAALVEIDRDLPALAGVVHAAGRRDDALLLALDDDSARAVAAPKVAGAWNLHRQTQGRDLDFFVLFSSAAGILGSEGQASYAGANTFLDAVAEHRRAIGLPGTAIAWGPWSDGGLASGAGDAAGLGSLGIVSLRAEQGVASLHRILGSAADPWVMALPLDLERVADAAANGLLPPLLAELATACGAREPSTGRESAVRAQLRAVEPGPRRQEVLVRHCQREAAQVLRLAPEAVNVQAPLASLGFDSLMSLELRKRLQSTLGLELPATLAWRFPSIDAMVPYLADAMGIALDEPPASPGADPSLAEPVEPDEPDEPAEPDEALDAATLEALLLQQLDDIERQPQP